MSCIVSLPRAAAGGHSRIALQTWIVYPDLGHLRCYVPDFGDLALPVAACRVACRVPHDSERGCGGVVPGDENMISSWQISLIGERPAGGGVRRRDQRMDQRSIAGGSARHSAGCRRRTGAACAGGARSSRPALAPSRRTNRPNATVRDVLETCVAARRLRRRVHRGPGPTPIDRALAWSACDISASSQSPHRPSHARGSSRRTGHLTGKLAHMLFGEDGLQRAPAWSHASWVTSNRLLPSRRRISACPRVL